MIKTSIFFTCKKGRKRKKKSLRRSFFLWGITLDLSTELCVVGSLYMAVKKEEEITKEDDEQTHFFLSLFRRKLTKGEKWKHFSDEEVDDEGEKSLIGGP